MARLDRLLRPKSIAVIGGGAWCENVIRECRKFGFAGALWAVHPTRRDVAGCPAVAHIADLPEPPDAAFIGVNRDATIKIVGELSAAGAGGAVCFASGFREARATTTDASDPQGEVVSAAGDMPILGPNCYGLINALDSAALWPDQHGLVRVDRGVAIISQSSNIALNLTMQQRGLPIACLVTVGNQAQTGLSEIGQALLDDDRVTAIGLYIEGIDNIAEFERFSDKANAQGKPVCVLKVGKTQQAQAATMSHTASLAGSMAGATALFERFGTVRVSSLSAMLETLKIQHMYGRLPSARVASMSCSGGEAGLMADTAAGTAVRFPPLAETQIHVLEGLLGPNLALTNPLDYHTGIWGNVDAMTATFATMVDGDAALGVVILDLPRADRCDVAQWLPTLAAVKRARRQSGKPFAVLSALPEGLPEAVVQDLMSEGIVPLCGLQDGIEAIAAAASECPRPHPAVFHPSPVPAPKTFDEGAAKTRLEAYGLRVPRHQTVTSADAAVTAASAIGFPVVLKGIGIAHKSDADAVALNLTSPEMVRKAAKAMPVTAFLVEEMVTDTLAELLLGIVRDPAHGMVLTLAAGGVLTEIMQDSTSLILPVVRDDVGVALRRLRYAPVLLGYRNMPACDLDAITDAVIALQDYAMSNPVVEVEVNPLLCGSNFAIAADALITCGEEDDS